MPPDTAVIDRPVAAAAVRHEARPPPASAPAGGSIFVLEFNERGNSAAYRTIGWSGQEDSFVWSVGGACELQIPAPSEPAPLILETDFTICLSRPVLTAAVVRVFVNGHLLGSARVSGWTRLRCHLPAELYTPGAPISLRYEHPNYVRPSDIGPVRDERSLGLCFYSIRLFPPSLTDAMQRFAPRAPEGDVLDVQAAHGPVVDEPTQKFAYRFAAGEAGAQHLCRGWRHDPEGNAWAHDHLCTAELPAPKMPGRYIVRFDLSPLIIRRVLTSQRITILVNGAVLGQFRIRTETSLAVHLPPELIDADATLRVTLVLPDGMAMHPFDLEPVPHFLSVMLDSISIEGLPPRHHALAGVRDDDVSTPSPIAVSEAFLDDPVDLLPETIKSTIGVGIADILRVFESLGDNCSFGLAQRKAGCDVMGLLRFANTPLPGLMIALEDAFKAMDDKAAFQIRQIDEEHKEYSLFLDRYGIRWHTNVNAGEADEDSVLAEQTIRLSYLRRKFFEALRAGRKIFAIARADPHKHSVPLPFAGERKHWEQQSDRLRLEEILPLFLRLNEYGTNTLLYLTRCANGRRPGTVELIALGIMRGYVDDFVITPNAEEQDHAVWMRLAANAWILDKGPNASFRSKVSP